MLKHMLAFFLLIGAVVLSTGCTSICRQVCTDEPDDTPSVLFSSVLLRVETSGNGRGTVKSTDVEINCNTPGEGKCRTLDHGSVVLIAKAHPGSIFKSWSYRRAGQLEPVVSPECPGHKRFCEFYLSEDTVVRAEFVAIDSWR